MATDDECYALLKQYKSTEDRKDTGVCSSPLLFALCLAAGCEIQRVTKTYVFHFCSRHATSHTCGNSNDMFPCIALAFALNPYVPVPVSRCPCMEKDEDEECSNVRGMLESDRVYNPKLTAFHSKLVIRFNQTRALLIHLAPTIVSFFNTISEPEFDVQYAHIETMRNNKLHKKQHQMRHGRNALVGDLLESQPDTSRLKDCNQNLQDLQNSWFNTIKPCKKDIIAPVKKMLSIAIAFLFSKEGSTVVEQLALNQTGVSVASKTLIIIMVLFPSLRFKHFASCILNSMLLHKNVHTPQKVAVGMNLYTAVQNAYINFRENKPLESPPVEEYVYIEDFQPYMNLWTENDE
ncbi:hypothetical protein [Ranid herpesvirus 3]|uniref:Uncharacterized protein n=1 Tax=Ranid herpesvirus 3 TaxID=1987509 RepID=A0A1X9T5K1_9VIRU|nr:hypothetical protein [Ranid herpesvirus 3]ARR28925.1 hypothetical protein [Ranid herpesvirus 3]